MAATSSLTLLADALAAVSKTTYDALAEVESQSRKEVARALIETREARHERDKVVKELHSAQLDTNSCKQEVIECKATLQQAELTIVHQTDKIAQLQRELSQWKDQSRNWQEHFLRVEQERCALSSRIDELVEERLQWSRMADSGRAPYTPKLRYNDVRDSEASSSRTNPSSIPSPSYPPPYKSVGQRSTSPTQALSVKPSKSKSKLKTGRAGKPAEDAPDGAENTATSSRKQKTKTPVRTERQEALTAPRQTVIRRVQAVIQLKQESDDESLREEQEGEEQETSPIQRRRRRSRRAIEDEDYLEDGSDVEHAVDEMEGYPDDDDDELMMGAEDNHEEVYSITPVQQKAPPKKRRRIGAKRV